MHVISLKKMYMNKRTFLKTSSVLAAGAALGLEACSPKENKEHLKILTLKIIREPLKLALKNEMPVSPYYFL